MENATEALKMSLAVFMFVIALSVVFSQLAKIKDTADTILFYSDKTNYYEYVEGDTLTGRIVDVDTVIATLKTYKKQSLYVKIIEKTGEKIFDYSPDKEKEVEEFISNNIGKKQNYSESIQKVTLNGEYKTAEDGTRVIIEPGTTRVYVIYKIIE